MKELKLLKFSWRAENDLEFKEVFPYIFFFDKADLQLSLMIDLNTIGQSIPTKIAIFAPNYGQED